MRKFLSIFIAILFLIGAPLLGMSLLGVPMEKYLVFPPITTSPAIDHAPFSWFAFFLFLFLIILVITPFLIKIYSSRKIKETPGADSYRFPGWGWIGLLIMIAGWVLAWTRFPWFSQFQTHTFTIPWIGYLILVNAFTYMRSGRSMITHQTGYFLLLFLFSAVFWWYFEFLNLFTQNWYYVNVETLGQSGFFLYATLPFATVLPAVISTMHLLRTFPGLSRGLGHFISIPVSNPQTTAVFGGLAATAVLTVTGVWPNYLFSMLWLAPTVIFAAAMVIAGVPTFLKDISKGDWKTVYLLALSALICGFFWEMWNFYSYTRWEYAIPFVDRFKIFEMPVLGYAGYLPFGLQCGLMAQLVKHMMKAP